MDPAALLDRLSFRHGLLLPPGETTSHRGATGTVICTGAYAIKLAHPDDAARAAVLTGARVAVVAERAGIVTPRVVLIDDRDTSPDTTVVVYRRVPGIAADEAGRHDVRLGPAWRAVGEQLAAIHLLDELPGLGELRRFRQTPELDPRVWLTSHATLRDLPPDDRAWLMATLAEVMPSVIASEAVRFCHGDVNADNVMVDATTFRFLALVDWSGAGWLDPVWDLAGLPLAVVPSVLAGYRSVRPFPDDDSAEARVLGVQLQTALYRVTLDPGPGTVKDLRERIRQGRVFRQATHPAGLG